MKEMEKKLHEMEKKLHEMEKKLHEMKNKLGKLEHLEAHLLIGEIASREEREMAKHILKDFPEINKREHPSVHQLNYHKNKIADQNWSDIEKQLSLLLLAYNSTTHIRMQYRLHKI